MSNYEKLDGFDHFLTDVTSARPLLGAPAVEPPPAANALAALQSGPRSRAALASALEIIDLVNGRTAPKDYSSDEVLGQVQVNLRTVMETIGALLFEVTVPGSVDSLDLGDVVTRATTALSTFSADPSAPPALEQQP